MTDTGSVRSGNLLSEGNMQPTWESSLPSENNLVEMTQLMVRTYIGVMSTTVLVAKPPLAPRTRRCEQRLSCY